MDRRDLQALSRIRLREARALLSRELRRIFGKIKSVEGMRLGGQVGDRFIIDGYAYRIV